MDLIKQGNSYNFDNLIVGTEIPLMTTGIEMLSGKGVIKRGSILTKDENGKYFLISSPTESLEGILTDDIDTEIETVTTMYRQGHFNSNALIYGDSINKIDELKDQLRKINILTSEIVN